MARQERVSVCVVGAGPAGLCAARQLAAHRAAFAFDVFERADQPGGMWLYTDRTGTDEHGLPVHSSMYKSLRTNFLQEVMCYPDYPFPEADDNSYPSHRVVLQYLQDFAAHFKLHQYIQFNTVVKAVTPRAADSDKAWSVLLQNLKTKEVFVKFYDAVMICSGYNSTPYIPTIMGIEAFKGNIMHCHDYRDPERYKDLTVAILGASFSGKDMSLEIATVAKTVYLSHSLAPIEYKMPSNIQQVTSIKEATADGFILEDGSSIKADALLYCTGYKYDLPFLNSECGISVRGKRITHLYRHLINIKYPTMALVGIPFIFIPFPFFYYQVAYFLKSLRKPSILPSTEEMYESEEKDFQERLAMGYPPRHAHKMGPLQWEYENTLADILGIQRIPPMYRELNEINTEHMKDFPTFRNYCHKEIYKKKLELSENQFTFNIEDLQL
ncbi:Senecionine N-oxygenase [Gryllus bimaculatus]|nr:Senecionine N-oxygenase [Gryllus bimaculatus]